MRALAVGRGQAGFFLRMLSCEGYLLNHVGHGA